MNSKKILFLGVIALFGIVLLSMNLVSAVGTVTLNTPVASGNVSGIYLLNATLDTNNGGTLNLTRAWFVADYNNGTNVTIASFVANVTDVGFNTSWNSALAPDSNITKRNITFWVIVANVTGTMGNTSDTSVAVVIDNTVPVITLPWYVNGTLKSNTDQLVANVSVTLAGNMSKASACRVNINGTNYTVPITFISTTIGTCNTTVLNLTGLSDGNHTINVYVNNSAGLVGQLITYTVFTDTEGSAVELTATSITKNTIILSIGTSAGLGSGISTCTADRTGATVTTTSLIESGLNCATDYTYIVTCTDANSNTGTAIKSFSTNSCGGTATNSPGVTTKKTNIPAGAATTLTYTDPTTGIKQISIEVNNNAQNVQITVTKEAGKPVAVSVAKTGKVYQYIHIETTNLADNLKKANVQFKVEKTWATANNVNKDNIVVSKFDEAAKKWNVLTTTYNSEDSSYYYYDVELTSFSYFAISEKSSVVVADETGTTTTETSSLTWLWIVLVVIVIVAVGYFLRKKK